MFKLIRYFFNFLQTSIQAKKLIAKDDDFLRYNYFAYRYIAYIIQLIFLNMSSEKSVEFEIYNLPIFQVLSGAKNLIVIFIPLKLFLYVVFVECNMTSTGRTN